MSAAARRALLVAGVVLNLASLGTFKYLDFLLASFEARERGRAAARPYHPADRHQLLFVPAHLLPGRSHARHAPIYPFRPFALFVLLYPASDRRPDRAPQRAGAAVRRRPAARGRVAAHRHRTCDLHRRVRARRCCSPTSWRRSSIRCSRRRPRRALDFGEAWTAVLAFSFQLFLDFSAYTEMAIGTALIFGVLLPENFRRPYLATDIRDFWRRWHISLSNFLRDYLYIPLGGSRHGAVALRACHPGRRWGCADCGTAPAGPSSPGACGTASALSPAAPGSSSAGRCQPVAGWALTMLFVMVGWVMFRASDFATAGSMLRRLRARRLRRRAAGRSSCWSPRRSHRR